MKVEHMIPNIYEQSYDMRIIARLIDAEAEILRYYTEHILDCYSPEHCPQNLLDDLAAHIGFDYQELKTVMYNRIVLKNFIKNLIRYRGSATGIGNAAAIDIRYRQTYPKTYFDPEAAQTGDGWVENPDYGKQIPMNFHEPLDIDKVWLDADVEAGIIYLFIIASDYFPKVTAEMTSEEKKANYEERMRRLLDLAYLQEYVRPVGMYLLPMVARKINPQTDLTVKAVRIPDHERNSHNGVEGTPNASMQHRYDRMLFAKIENPDDDMSVEPWIRTLYHSQLAGTLNHEYFTKPVYHIEGKFLYYNHDELLDIYTKIMESPQGTLGMKVGDSLYNPNLFKPVQDYSYGPNPDDEHEPESLEQLGIAEETYADLAYDDHVGFPKPRTYQYDSTIVGPVKTEPDEPYPIYLDVRATPAFVHSLLETQDEITLATEDGILLAVRSSRPATPYTGTHELTVDSPGDGDDGTNKNLMINLFQVDAADESEWTGAHDIHIAGKGPVPRNPVPYDPATNGEPVGDDTHLTVKNADLDNDPEMLIP